MTAYQRLGSLADNFARLGPLNGLVILTAVLVLGCTVPNPRYCDEDDDCKDNYFCDFSVHRCVPSDCGNGVIERGEQCDGSTLGSETCIDVSPHSEGTLRCSDQCTYDVSLCHTCGNGTVEGPEQCDGDEMGGSTCQDHGYTGGQLACTGQCAFYFINCTGGVCGNGIVEGGEDCDGTDLAGATCSTETSHQDGTLACSDQCAYDASDCHTCGNGTREGPEDCDGTDLGGATCQDQGHTGGTLSCTGACQFDVSQCSDCGDGACELTLGEDHANCPDDCGWVLVHAGGGHTCANKNDGTTWCWGDDRYGQIGDNLVHQDCGGFECSPFPAIVPGIVDAVLFAG